MRARNKSMATSNRTPRLRLMVAMLLVMSLAIALAVSSLYSFYLVERFVV